MQLKYSPDLLKKLFRTQVFPLVALCTFVLAAASCSYRRSLPLKGPLENRTASVDNGEVLYMQKCQRCHPQGEGGLGPAMNHIPNPPKRLQIRLGFGAMPAFNKKDLPKEELDDVMAYLKALRNNRK
jgi:mono/diheme cytochrome c family protein